MEPDFFSRYRLQKAPKGSKKLHASGIFSCETVRKSTQKYARLRSPIEKLNCHGLELQRAWVNKLDGALLLFLTSYFVFDFRCDSKKAMRACSALSASGPLKPWPAPSSVR